MQLLIDTYLNWGEIKAIYIMNKQSVFKASLFAVTTCTKRKLQVHNLLNNCFKIML
jgi:hypothetical protein